MGAVELKILQEILLGLNVLEAAQPYIDKIVAMGKGGATAEQVLAECQSLRKASGARLDAHLAAE